MFGMFDISVVPFFFVLFCCCCHILNYQFCIPFFAPLFSLDYSKWVPQLTEYFSDSLRLNNSGNGNTPTDDQSQKYFEQALVINALGAALIGLIIVMPILVLHPKFRFRPQRIITVTHDRYG